MRILTKKVVDVTSADWVDGLSVASQGGLSLRFFGWNNSWSPTTTSDVYSFHAEGQPVFLETAPCNPRHSHNVFEYNDGDILIAGGDLLVTPQKDSWLRIRSGIWSERSSDWGSEIGICTLAGSCMHKNIPFIAGGQRDYTATDFQNSVFKTTDKGQTWVKVSDLPSGLQNRSTPVMESCKDAEGNVFMIIGAGAIYNQAGHTVFYSDYWRSDDDGLTWVKISEGLPDMATIYPTGFFDVKSKLLFHLNGYNSGNRRGLYYSPDFGVNWKQVLYNTVAPTHASCIARVNGKLFVVQGNENPSIDEIIVR